MTISDELQKLDDLRRNGTISYDEFEIAKRKVLEGTQEAPRSEHLEEIRAQNELAQLDREWELERENYMVAGSMGTSTYLEGSVARSEVSLSLVLVSSGRRWLHL